MAKEYTVNVLQTGFFTSTLSASKLEKALNWARGSEWKFVKSIHEEKRVLLFFKREAHYLIFERECSAERVTEIKSTFEQEAQEGKAGVILWVFIVIIGAFVAAMLWKMKGQP